MALNKEELVAALTAAGVELTGEEKLPELKEMYKALPKDNADDSDDNADDNADDAADAGKGDAAPVKKGKFQVSDSNGKVLPHTYKTKEDAEEAAKVYGGKVVVPEKE